MNYRKYTRRHLGKGFLGRIFKNWLNNFSVTTWIIILNVIFFIVALFLGVFTGQCGETVCKYIALQPANILHGSRYLWTFLTSMFMHGGFGHLLINMFVLFSLGRMMERIIGKKRYFWFYLISGLFAGLVFVLLAGLLPGFESIVGSNEAYAVGASGAIFAVAGLFVMLIPKARFMIIFLPFFSLPGYIMVPAVLILTWIASIATGLPVGNSAHLGGFLFGLGYGLYLRGKYKNKIKQLNKMLGY
jgi:membrane associated rhomboid family serine protease